MQTTSRQPSHHHGFLASRLMSSLISDSQTPGPLPLPAELLSREQGLEAVQSPDSPCCVQRGCFCGFCPGPQDRLPCPGSGSPHVWARMLEGRGLEGSTGQDKLPFKRCCSPLPLYSCPHGRHHSGKTWSHQV